MGKLTDLWVNYLALVPGADGSYAMTFYETRGHRQGLVPTPYQNTVWREFDWGAWNSGIRKGTSILPPRLS
ncbi:hypothetical protein WJ971_28370 [Achromobacter xylosoxidans]